MEGFPQTAHAELSGIYTVRASDGGGLSLVSRNPFGGFHAVGHGRDVRELLPRWPMDRFRGPQGNLDLVHPDGTGLTRVPVDLGEGQPLQPRWSPDGTTIVFGLRMKGRETSTRFAQTGRASCRSPIRPRSTNGGPTGERTRAEASRFFRHLGRAFRTRVPAGNLGRMRGRERAALDPGGPTVP